MALFETLLKSARGDTARIVFSEGEDPRVIEAAWVAVRDVLARPTLIGSRRAIETQLSAYDPADAPISIIDPDEVGSHGHYAETYYARRRHKGVTLEQAVEAVRSPLILAALMVHLDEADGAIGGAVATTAETVRTALQVIGPGDGVKTVSSSFLMSFEQDYHAQKGVVCFADCGLIAEPTLEQLVQIAISSADNFSVLTDQRPRIAMLSFSTHGSASHPQAEKMAEAARRVRTARPDLLVDGELQFDAAFLPQIAKTKAPTSPLEGRANVFIFPDLGAGNIAYKIAQRVGGAIAIGPIIQGLAKPANDLSRGCTTEDIIQMIAVTCAQVRMAKR